MANFHRSLRTAEGFLELGLPLDADEELERIASGLRTESEVLRLRVKIYFKLQRWDLMPAVAQTLGLRHPEDVGWTIAWAQATALATSFEAAKVILLKALERSANDAEIHYHLACLECQMGSMQEAAGGLKRAIALHRKYHGHAFDDAYLKALWDSLGK